jgi:uncharacterized membrane protein YhaH (DUF805 family)
VPVANLGYSDPAAYGGAGQGPYGQPAYGGPGPYGQSAYGDQGTYGQPAYGGQGPYGQPAYGDQNPYGQPGPSPQGADGASAYTPPAQPAGVDATPYRTYPDPSLVPRGVEPANPYGATYALAPDPYGPVNPYNAPAAPYPIGPYTPLFGAPPRPSVGLLQAVKLMFKNGFNFSGRASRSEFWLAWLAWIIFIIGWFVAIAFAAAAEGPFGDGTAPGRAVVVGMLVMLAAAVPFIALQVRRLHDANLSGAFWFLNLIPLGGAIATLFLMGQASKPEAGHFDDPTRLPKTE